MINAIKSSREIYENTTTKIIFIPVFMEVLWDLKNRKTCTMFFPETILAFGQNVIYIKIVRNLGVNYFSNIFPGRAICEIGLQSFGSWLFLVVLGMGVTLLAPHAFQRYKHVKMRDINRMCTI